MKKFLLRFLFAILVLAILGLVGVGLFLDSAVKKGVETVGPMITGVPIRLDSVKLSLFSGSGKIQGFVLGNPQGYNSPSSISIAEASLGISPGSLLSDKIVIKSINVQAPEITFETDLKGNNLSKILAKLQDSNGTNKTATTSESKPQKKLEVDDFVLNGAKMRVLVTPLNGSATVPCPPVHLTDLGKSNDGITPAELAEVVLKAVCDAAAQASQTAIADIQKGGIHMSGDVGTIVTNSTVDSVTKGLSDMLKKK